MTQFEANILDIKDALDDLCIEYREVGRNRRANAVCLKIHSAHVERFRAYAAMVGWYIAQDAGSMTSDPQPERWFIHMEY